MKQNKQKQKIKLSTKGFTLLELLVVVLIIGILAGIALPQYRKSIVKSKLAEVDLAVGAAKQSIRIYLDANGWPGEDEEVFFTGSDSVGSIDLPGDCDSDDVGCETELAIYVVYCNAEYCLIDIWLKFLNDYAFDLRMNSDHEVWFLDWNYSKEVCQWAKERNYPAAGHAITHCSEVGVTLEEYKAE